MVIILWANHQRLLVVLLIASLEFLYSQKSDRTIVFERSISLVSIYSGISLRLFILA